MTKAKCPCCLTSFEPSAEAVEIELRMVQELGGERIRTLYCQGCGKKIREKGLEHWADSLDRLIRSTLITDEQKPKEGVKG